MAKTKVHSTASEIVNAHGLIEFYFGERNTSGDKKDIADIRDKMAKAERELLSQNKLERNYPADKFLRTIQERKQGYHSLEDIFIKVIKDPELDALNQDIIVNLIKVSPDVLRQLNIYSYHGFISYKQSSKEIFIKKAGTRPEYKNWMLVGLNREIFI